MFSRLWRSNQIILCVMSGGSLEKLTRAVTYWRYICFLRFRGFFFGVFRVFLGCSWFSWECSGFFWGVPGFFGCSGMFRDVPVFRCSVFRCSWKYYMPFWWGCIECECSPHVYSEAKNNYARIFVCYSTFHFCLSQTPFQRLSNVFYRNQ